MKKMKEPPTGSVVISKSGSAWQLNPTGWSMAGNDGSWSYSWKQLLKELYEPMHHPTQEWEPVLGDSRLPFIVYVPHEELFEDTEIEK